MIFFRSIHAKLDRLLAGQAALMDHLTKRSETVSVELSELAAEVTANTDAVASVVTVVDRLADELEAAADDPAEVRALVDNLRANNNTLAEAVAANTPAGEAVPEEPPA